MSIVERMDRCFQESFATEPGLVQADSTPEDIEKWDSIGHMNLVAVMEKEFDLQFEVDQIMEMIDLPAIIEILKSKGIED